MTSQDQHCLRFVRRGSIPGVACNSAFPIAFHSSSTSLTPSLTACFTPCLLFSHSILPFNISSSLPFPLLSSPVLSFLFILFSHWLSLVSTLSISLSNCLSNSLSHFNALVTSVLEQFLQNDCFPLHPFIFPLSPFPLSHPFLTVSVISDLEPFLWNDIVMVMPARMTNHLSVLMAQLQTSRGGLQH